jgi:hypothetical protein
MVKLLVLKNDFPMVLMDGQWVSFISQFASFTFPSSHIGKQNRPERPDGQHFDIITSSARYGASLEFTPVSD